MGVHADWVSGEGEELEGAGGDVTLGRQPQPAATSPGAQPSSHSLPPHTYISTLGRKHHVMYDDGEQGLVDMGDAEFEYLPSPPSASSPAAAAAAAAATAAEARPGEAAASAPTTTAAAAQLQLDAPGPAAAADDVGRRLHVWWPLNRVWYSGVVTHVLRNGCGPCWILLLLLLLLDVAAVDYDTVLSSLRLLCRGAAACIAPVGRPAGQRCIADPPVFLPPPPTHTHMCRLLCVLYDLDGMELLVDLSDSKVGVGGCGCGWGARRACVGHWGVVWWKVSSLDRGWMAHVARPHNVACSQVRAPICCHHPVFLPAGPVGLAPPPEAA